MHASACSLVFFSQGRDTAALWRQGRTGKTSGPLPLRVYPDVLRSRLAGAKSGLLRFRVGDKPTPV
ncbi:hypothetical protein [Aneurinibacillus migulanus]|uniref:hypothetical protein n=1 Tax=Aneurinibacillus migulanus TaxID=47500 RepID=UPI001113B96C|nr:hypothetical protein [Aneurinibacillus migulanus]MED1615676.1 hypothetical protein [Aneurinibacillus migulanus]